MIKVKIIAPNVFTSYQAEQEINDFLKLLQEECEYKVLDIKFSNFQAMIIYEEKEQTKKKLNEKV